MHEKIRIAVFEEHPLFRRGVVKAIERNADMVVVAEGNLADVRNLPVKTAVDILLVGARGGDLEDAQKIMSGRKGLRVAILTASEKDEHLSDAIRAGAMGYILKGVSGPELLQALDGIHKGALYITPELATKIVVERLQPLPPEVISDEVAQSKIGLSYREREVLGHLALGLSRKEMAKKMGVTISAVKHYTTNLFRKFRVRNRIEAISAGRRLNFV